MKRAVHLAVIMAALVLFPIAVRAHHAAQAQFDLSKAIVLEGTCHKMEWVNPHAYMTLGVKDNTGKVRLWKLETVGPAGLRRAGLSRGDASIKCDPLGGGSNYIVRGFPSRNGSDIALMVDLKLPDGRIVKLIDADEFQLPPNFEIPK